MLAVFASNQGRHEFGENYEDAVVKKTERHYRLVHVKKRGKHGPVCSWSSAGILPLSSFQLGIIIQQISARNRHSDDDGEYCCRKHGNQ